MPESCPITMGETVFSEIDELRRFKGIENIQLHFPGEHTEFQFKVEVHYSDPDLPTGGRKRFWSNANMADAVYAAYRWVKDSREVAR